MISCSYLSVSRQNAISQLGIFKHNKLRQGPGHQYTYIRAVTTSTRCGEPATKRDEIKMCQEKKLSAAALVQGMGNRYVPPTLFIFSITSVIIAMK